MRRTSLCLLAVALVGVGWFAVPIARAQGPARPGAAPAAAPGGAPGAAPRGLSPAAARDLADVIDLSNRPVADIRVEGLKQVNPQLVLNQVRLSKGDPYSPKIVQEDIVRITHLGRFSSVTARVTPQADGSVVLTYVVTEQPLLADVQVVGNKELNDQELLALVVLKAGDPIDPFLIDRGVKEIKRAYEKEGYFTTDVTVDQELLKESNILIYRVREGPLVHIRAIQFEGNTVFSTSQLKSKIKSETYLFILRKGELSREQLEADAATIRDFYRDRGYLDAQVGRRIDLSPDQASAVVVFIVSEGRRYTVDKIAVEGNQAFATAQIIDAMPLKSGDVFSQDKLKKSEEALIDLYGKLGYIETHIDVTRLFQENQPRVDISVKIQEGHAYNVGKVVVTGNQLTQDKVVYRQVRGMQPGRPFDRAGIKETEKRLKEYGLFEDASVTVLGDPAETTRDVNIELKEKSTGRLGFGAGISSDAGVIGAIDLTQSNFDIADLPESFGELFSGKAFRGAGQYFGLNIQPGTTTSQYSVTFREPYLLDTQYFLNTTAFYWTRDWTEYNEGRYGGRLGMGQRFGDVWQASVDARGENVDISNLSDTAPQDVWDVAGNSIITSLGLDVVRNTTDSRLFPTRGSVLDMGLSQAGALGGDYNFTKVDVAWRKFWTVDEDFYGRRTVVSLRAEAGYIFQTDQAPVFERFYAGGHRSLRGFRYRGVGPVGFEHGHPTVPSDLTVGGDWLFLMGAEYNYPIYQEILRHVIFIDTGTVQNNIGFNQYRVSIGTGIRLKIPFLGQAPFALDVAIPILKQLGDRTQFFSFDLAVPF